jgi:hypothetical protein
LCAVIAATVRSAEKIETGAPCDSMCEIPNASPRGIGTSWKLTPSVIAAARSSVLSFFMRHPSGWWQTF